MEPQARMTIVWTSADPVTQCWEELIDFHILFNYSLSLSLLFFSFILSPPLLLQPIYVVMHLSINPSTTYLSICIEWYICKFIHIYIHILISLFSHTQHTRKHTLTWINRHINVYQLWTLLKYFSNFRISSSCASAQIQLVLSTTNWRWYTATSEMRSLNRGSLEIQCSVIKLTAKYKAIYI